MEGIDEVIHLLLTYPPFDQYYSNFQHSFQLELYIASLFYTRISGQRRRKKMFLEAVAVLLTWVTLICLVESAPLPSPPPGPYIPSGHDKDAWPELLNMDVDDAVRILNTSGFVQNVYVQPPSSGPAPYNLGKNTDVWVYTDGSTVYEIPRRGVWHANRLIPGWPEVTGMWYKSAIAKIKVDYLGVTVVYGPKGSVFRTTELRMDRVYVDINPDSTVAGIPSVG